MARDGTYRGGRRVRAGDKPDTLADKIASGNSAQILDFPDFDLNGVPEGEVKRFVDFTLSARGQKIAEQVGFVTVE